jgi:GNAT superfamily N-acetyltransferase
VIDALAVRELESGDLDALLALYRHLHASDQPLAPERARSIWAAIMTDPQQLYVGGFIGEELVAACNAAITPNLTRGGRPFAVIENVVTAAAHRRRGHGAAVLCALLERCWARDCYKVMLMSGAGRDSAHAFYDAVGFDRASKQAFVIKP